MRLSYSGEVENTPSGYLPWFEAWEKPPDKTTVIFGHWSALGFYRRENLLCLDSGCLWGRQLTAMRLEDEQIFQVPGGGTMNMSASKLQLSDSGRLLHLLTLEDLPPKIIYSLFAAADKFAAHKPSPDARPLSGKLFVNIFFESSTRTRTAFEASARQLGADVVNLDRITMSGETKSETLRDTVLTIAAMGAAGIALRHGENGAAVQAAAAAPPNFAVINGGDGENAHPTQGLTDAYTLRERVGEDFSGLSIAIVGDVLHSRVARSDLHIFRTLGATDIRLVGPPSLCPQELQDELGATVINDMADGINGVDVVALLRVQRERLNADETGLSARNTLPALAWMKNDWRG